MTVNGRSLRVLVVGISWPPETFLARLLRGLTARGIEVTVATSQRPDRSWLDDSNIEWIEAPDGDQPAAVRLLRGSGQLGAAILHSPADVAGYYRASSVQNGRSKLLKLQRWLPYAGLRWDVVYFPWNSAAITNQALFELAPVVISCRGSQINIAPHNPKRRALVDGLWQTLGRASAVHCVSEAIRDEATQYGLDPTRATVIRPAVDPDFFQPGQSQNVDESLYLVSTGSLLWVKGYEYALQAIRLLADRGIPVRYDIIGDGPERQRVQFTLQDLAIDDRVQLLGRLTPEQVVGRLQAADIYLLSSLSEGISNAALEAMACGLPVVGSAVGGMEEAIRDGVEGLLVPSRSPEAMAAAVERLWHDPQRRSEMGAAARRRITADFTLDQQLEAFSRLLESVA